MQHFEFFIGALLVLSVVGTPVILASTGTHLAYRDLLPAPIIGAGVLSIGATVLYRWGIPPYLTTFYATLISAVASVGYFIWFGGEYRAAGGVRCSRAIAVRVVSCGSVIVLILLPHYLGGQQFAIFQGNRHDTVNYLSGAVGFANYSYAHLSSFDPASEPVAGLAEAAALLMARPAVAILYASLYKLFSSDFLINAYDYCLVGQLNFYFAFLYLMLNCFPRRERILHFAAVAFGVGFFAQYVLDINAWSELFAVPMMVVLLTDFCRGLLMVRPSRDGRVDQAGLPPKDPPDRATVRSARLAFLFVRLPVTAAGMMYVYPEISPLAGLAGAGALACMITADIRRGDYWAAWKSLIATALVATIALVLMRGYWQGTIGFLLFQVQMTASTDVGWYRFFQAYLFGGTSEIIERLRSAGAPAYLFYLTIALPANFLAGFFGLYFLQPRTLWIKPLTPYFLLWLPILLFWLSRVTLAVIASVRIEFARWRSGSGSSLFGPIAVGGLVAFAVPVGLLLQGKYWAAGKGLSMLAPFVFAALVVPIVGGRTRRNTAVLCSIVLGVHLCFGIYRPIIVGIRADGSHFGYPYPSLGKESRNVIDWDVSRYEADIEKCTLVKVDIVEPFLERIVENYLVEKKIQWFSPNPQWSYYGVGSQLPMMRAPDGKPADCTIATESKADSIGRKIILSNAK
jgi:hypothetical protein